MRLKSSFIYMVSLGLASSAGAYLVQQGDTLSSIAYKEISPKVYGKNGSLKKLLTLNPQIKNLNVIFPGQEIVIGKNESIAAKEPELVRAVAAEEAFAPAKPLEQAQAQAPAVTVSDEFSRIEMFFSLGQSRIDAKDSRTSAESIMGSKLSPELGAQWSQFWDSGFVSFLAGKIRHESFETTSLTQTFSKKTPTLLDFEIGARAYKSSSFNLDLALGYEQAPFVRGVSATEFTVDVVSVPRVQARAQISLKESKTFLVSANLGAKYLSTANEADYSVKSGYGYSLGLAIEHKRERNPFFGGVNFSKNIQDSSIASQSYTTIGLVFGTRFDVLGGGK